MNACCVTHVVLYMFVYAWCMCMNACCFMRVVLCMFVYAWCMHVCMLCVFMRARYDMHARGQIFDRTPPRRPSMLSFSVVSFLVVLVVWFLGRVVVGVLIRVSLRAVFLIFSGTP